MSRLCELLKKYTAEVQRNEKMSIFAMQMVLWASKTPEVKRKSGENPGQYLLL